MKRAKSHQKHKKRDAALSRKRQRREKRRNLAEAYAERKELYESRRREALRILGKYLATKEP